LGMGMLRCGEREGQRAGDQELFHCEDSPRPRPCVRVQIWKAQRLEYQRGWFVVGFRPACGLDAREGGVVGVGLGIWDPADEQRQRAKDAKKDAKDAEGFDGDELWRGNGV